MLWVALINYTALVQMVLSAQQVTLRVRLALAKQMDGCQTLSGFLLQDCNDQFCAEGVEKWPLTFTELSTFSLLSLKKKKKKGELLQFWNAKCIKVEFFFFFLKVTRFQVRKRWGESEDVSTHLQKQRSFILSTPSNHLKKKKANFFFKLCH